jgi:pyruvate-ferredoxin/flavodoxin oxidoreductase
MGEWADARAAAGERNLWGTTPAVIEMQSEGGAAGVVHGALQTGALATTFTASQGLLLMLPNMFKIAGELTPAVFHIAARTIATHALSIFGDHSDVMTARPTGWGMLCSSSVQEAQDLAVIAHAATLESRVPFLHFFDGFRTSHEINKIDLVDDTMLRAMIDEERIREHRARALSPEHPVLRGSAQNPDVFFQSRERPNPYYDACPSIVERSMARFAELTGRRYSAYEYHGAPDAERVIVLMGSAAETAMDAADFLNEDCARCGVVKVRMFRPFDAAAFAKVLPASVQSIAVLDRCKEPGAPGDPLYLDVLAALHQARRPVRTIIGGRYGLASKEFTPGIVKAVFDHLAQTRPHDHFTVGIHDDVTHSSLAWDESLDIEPNETFRAVFHGLGSDGTVGANKETIKIIGEGTGHFAQAYFVYDSKKAGAATVSHLRFGPHPIRASYLVRRAHFVGCHQPQFVNQFDIADELLPHGVLLLNTSTAPEKVWEQLPAGTQRKLLARHARLFAIDGSRVARECGLRGRVNTVMQTCFFAVSGVLPTEEAIAAIKDSIRRNYGKKGESIVQMNLAAVDATLANLHEIASGTVKAFDTSEDAATDPRAPAYVRDVAAKLIVGRADRLAVSALPLDGTFPTGTSRWEKRNLAAEIPVWDPDLCIQCGKCVFVCPHAAIRSKVYEPAAVATAPASFKSHDPRFPAWKDLRYTLQVAPEDCTGCGICVEVCPVRSKAAAALKAINMKPQPALVTAERENWEFFLSLPQPPAAHVKPEHVRELQIREPLFEFSGACAGCGETPYLKLLAQLFGDRLLVANATGCSSIFGGNLPTTPWAVNAEGRGPAWSNSLFEDNAEFGFGFRIALDQQREFATTLLNSLAPQVGDTLVRSILEARQQEEADIVEQRDRIATLKAKLASLNTESARALIGVADALVRKSVWIVGGDGWAYDIGFGGLDHVLASGRNVKVLVLDTEVYSNTGGQSSKATPRGAVAKFAAGEKQPRRRILGSLR